MKYGAHILEQAFELALLGVTNDRLAEIWGISSSTISLWLETYPDLAATLKRGREDADAQVVKSLYKRALGYDVVTRKIIETKDGPLEVEQVEHIKPDVTAQIFWLKNRQRKYWRDRHEIENTGTPLVDNRTISVNVLEPEQRDQLRALLEQAKAAGVPEVGTK